MAEILYNPHFEPYLECKNRYAILFGGAGSGKSVVAAQKHVQRCLNNSERHKILVIRKFRTTLEGSVFSLIKSTIRSFGIDKFVETNNTKMHFKFHNGNEIWCTGLDDPEKLKSIDGITSVWVEEGTEIEEEDFRQLDLRLRGHNDSYYQITVTFNPISIDHWLHSMFFENEDTGAFTLFSNYKHNLFLDEQYIHVLENRFKDDPNMRRIYVDGEWGRERTGGEFYSSWDVDRCVQRINYNPELNIHMSWDFNINPYLPVSLWHIWKSDGVYKVGCFDLLTMENPYNNTEDACEEFIERYPVYDLGIFIYGDASGRVKSTSSRVHNYDIIEQKLSKYVRNWSWRVPKRNPLYNKRRDFINRVMGGGYDDIEFIVDPSCKLMITDFENVMTDLDSKKWVRKGKNKAGVPFEKHGHYSDTADYLLCSAFYDRYKNFGVKML